MKVQGLCSSCATPCTQTCKGCGQAICMRCGKDHKCGK